MKKLISAIAILFLLCVGNAFAAISFVAVSTPVGQFTNISGNAFTVTTTTGNLNVAVIITSLPSVVSTVSDNKGNTWTIAPSGAYTGGNVYIAYSLSAAAGVTTVNVVPSSNGDGISLALFDLSSSTGGALDTTAVLNSQTSANPAPSLTAAGAGFVVAAVLKESSSTAVASPFTQASMDFSTTQYWTAAAYDVNSSGGLLTSTFTSTASNNWASVIAAFKEASVGPSAQCSPRAVLQY